MKRITILYIIDTFFEMAGAERNLYEVITHLNPNRYRPIVVCLQGGELVNSVKEKGIEIINLDLKRIYTPLGFIKAIGIIRLINQQDVKIIVTYHESSDFLGGIIARLARVPVVISSRRDMGYKLKKRHIFIYKLINLLFDRIVIVSDAVKDIIFDRENVLWHKLLTIHNGVELEKFSKHIDKEAVRNSLGLDNKPVVGMLAALRPIKGHKYFLEAASIIVKSFPEVNFLIVGWYDKGAYCQELKNLTRELGIEKKVTFTGGRSDTPEILSIMDISVISSINEGFSNTILESMAAGKPVVATNTGGTPEAVVDSETGFLVPPCDSEALANAILRLLQNKELAKNMGIAARRRVKQNFLLNGMIKNIENFYENILQAKADEAIARNIINTQTSPLKIAKVFFANILYYSGLLLLLRKLMPSSKGINILAYHSVSDEDSDYLGMNIKIENFEKQMMFLKKYYNLISLSKAVQLLKNKTDIPNNACVITFDDGYKDNYENAFPILKKYQIPATIFLSVDIIDNKQMLWFDIIKTAVKLTNREDLELGGSTMKRYKLSSPQNKTRTIKELVSYAKSLTISDREKFLIYLLEKLEFNFEDINKYNHMLDWNEIIEMRNSGIEFGSHGLTHSILTNLSTEEIENEIRESKMIIQEKTGIEVKLFAYPNGGINDFNRDTELLLKKHNFTAACTLIRGANNEISNLTTLRRICVNSGMESNLSGRFSKTLFELEISRFF